MAKDSYKKYVKGPGESNGLHVDRATFHARQKQGTSDGYMKVPPLKPLKKATLKNSGDKDDKFMNR